MDPPKLDNVVFADAIENYKPQLRDFFSKDSVTFSNYTNVSQGEVGDCWLLAPISALARSTRLRKILQNNFVINDRGYTITVYKDGVKTPIHVNGNLFFIPRDGDYKADLLFAGQQQFLPEKSLVSANLLWFAFIEKAVAILYGGYHLLDGGDPGSVDSKQADLGFKILTGLPVTTILIDQTTDFKGKIKTFLSEGASIVFTTKANNEVSSDKSMKTEPNGEDNSGLNLLEDHAYVVDSISRDGSVKLYNPHGEFARLKQNISKVLTENDARFFGKRLDIIAVSKGGKTRTRKTRRRHK